MNKMIHVFTAGFLLVALSCVTASAAIILDDPLDGSAIGVASGIDWVAGASGGVADKAAGLAQASDYIKYYDAGTPYKYFAAQGTVGFYLKATGAYTILDTVGNAGAAAGDLTFGMLATKQLRFCMYSGSAWQWFVGNTVLDSSKWSYVAINYGSGGMKIYVNGVQEPGTWTSGSGYSGNLRNAAMYVGDYQPDGANKSFIGTLDRLRASNVQSDSSVLTAPAVPEPSSLLALVGGIAPALLALKRRRV